MEAAKSRALLVVMMIVAIHVSSIANLSSTMIVVTCVVGIWA